MKRTLKTITHKGKLSVEYKKDEQLISIIPTKRPLLTIAQLITNMEEDIHRITNVTVTITYD